MINQMDLVYILTQMELDMKVNGVMINRKEMAKNFGLMEQYMKDNIKMGKKMDKGNFPGRMGLFILENLRIII